METILIIHITDKRLELDDDSGSIYCHSLQNTNYKILYAPLAITNPSEKQEDRFMSRLGRLTQKISDNRENINAIFIYSQQKEIIKKTYMIVVLSHVYVAYQNDSIYCLYVLSDKNDTKEIAITDENIQTQARINNLGDIKYKRFLNVIETTIGIKRTIKKDYEVLEVSKLLLNENYVNLNCQWWFSYLINVFAGCGKGRFMQISGTCYLNSIVNGIILSPRLGKMMLMYMNEKIKSEGTEFKEFLEKDITTCYRRGIVEKNYFYQLLYNVFCKKTKITEVLSQDNPNSDIFVKYSKIYSVEKDTGQGGIFQDTFYKLLDDCIGKRVYDVNALRRSYSDIIVLIKDYIDDFIRVGNFSNLEFGYLVLQGTVSGTSELAGHAMCGFVCKKEFYIYDSGSNMMFNVNWTDNVELENFLEYYNSIFPNYIFTTIKLQNIVLSNPNRWEMYERLGVCPEI